MGVCLALVISECVNGLWAIGAELVVQMHDSIGGTGFVLVRVAVAMSRHLYGSLPCISAW